MDSSSNAEAGSSVQTGLPPVEDGRAAARPYTSFRAGLPTVFLALLAGACAKVADPLPPLSHHPPPVNDLQAVRAADQVRLLFSLPSPDIQSVEVHRLCGGEPPTSEPIARLNPGEIAPAPDSDGLMFADTPPQGGSCRYRIRLIGPGGLPSPFSEWAALPL